MIIDVVTYNGEADLFDIRYNILKDYVDEFIVVEFPTTFSGKDKPLYFQDIKDKYPKVLYFNFSKTATLDDKFWCVRPGKVAKSAFLTDYPADAKILELADNSPNVTKDAEHWRREFYQKESIKKVLELLSLDADDIVFIGDCDEIWDRVALNIDYCQKLRLRVYTYYLNNRSTEEFYGGIISTYGVIKDECLNHLRTTRSKTDYYYGWHFTSMGGYESVKKKLEDSYTKETYATDQVIDNLETNIVSGKDFLGRNFIYTIDESDWPQYLKDNKEKYIHLCK